MGAFPARVMGFAFLGWSCGVGAMDIEVGGARGGASPSSARPAGSSVARAPSRRSGGGQTLFGLRSSYVMSGEMPDFRDSSLSVNREGAPTPRPEFPPGTESRMRVTRANFEFYSTLYQEGGSFVFGTVALPLQSVTARNAAVVQGSEFGGLGLGLEGQFSLVSARLLVVQSRSEKLKLFDSHSEGTLGLYLNLSEAMSPGVPVSVTAGPEFSIPLGDGSSTALYRYGSGWGGRARVLVENGTSSVGSFRVGLEALLRRISSYSIAGINQGGAGMLSVSPSFELHLWETLWIGMRADLPVFRPKDRLAAFGSASLPGLLGSTLGFTLRAAVL